MGILIIKVYEVQWDFKALGQSSFKALDQNTAKKHIILVYPIPHIVFSLCSFPPLPLEKNKFNSYPQPQISLKKLNLHLLTG